MFTGGIGGVEVAVDVLITMANTMLGVVSMVIKRQCDDPTLSRAPAYGKQWCVGQGGCDGLDVEGDENEVDNDVL